MIISIWGKINTINTIERYLPLSNSTEENVREKQDVLHSENVYTGTVTSNPILNVFSMQIPECLEHSLKKIN